MVLLHCADKSCVMKALKNTEKHEIDGQILECSLAKPQMPTANDSEQSGKAKTCKPVMIRKSVNNSHNNKKF